MTRVEIDEAQRVVTTKFDDGSELKAAPNFDPESRARADSLGYPYASYGVWQMTKDHERIHTLLAEAQGYPVSLALWYAANPNKEMRAADKLMAHIEERTVLLIQRLLNEGLDRVWAEREGNEAT